MEKIIISLSDRGQITIPKKIRKQMPTERFLCHIEHQKIVLEPLQTREEFLDELDKTEKDWEKKGGSTIKQMKKKHNL